MGWPVKNIGMLIWVIFLNGCQTIPDHEVCQLDLQKNGGWCAMTGNPNAPYFKTLQDMDNGIVRTPEGEQALRDWAKRNCSK